MKRLRLLWSRHRSASKTLLLTESQRQVTFDFRNHCHARTVPCMSNGHSVFLRPGMTSDLSLYLKCCVGEALAVLGEVHLPCWKFIVVPHGGNVPRDVFSVPQQLIPIAPRTVSSSQMVSHFLQLSWESRGCLHCGLCYGA